MTTIDTLTAEAFEHHKAGRFSEAEALYDIVLVMDEDNFQALQLLGTLCLSGGRIADAHKQLSRALEILKKRGDEGRRHASLYNNLGIALRALGRNDEAIRHFDQGIVLDPSLTELHISLGGALLEAGDPAGSAASFERALVLNPDMPGCLCDLGTVYARSGRTGDAVEMYERALQIDPDFEAARANLEQIRELAQKTAIAS